MKIVEVLGKTKEHFKKLGFESASLDAELLISSALNWKRLDLFLKQEYPLSEKELSDCRDLVRRRSKGEPVAYILGKKEFYSIQLNVNPSVLIPRPETEHLVDEAMSYVRDNDLKAPKVLDLGAGSGCIGLALLNEIPEAKLVAVEKSEAAAKMILENAKLNSLDARITIVNKSVEELNQSDLGEGAFDILVSNPPYIEKGDSDLDKQVFAFEPEEALFAEEKGYLCYRTWPDLVKKYMKERSIAIFEIGHKQASEVKELFEAKEFFSNIEIIKDYSAKDRVVKAHLQ